MAEKKPKEDTGNTLAQLKKFFTGPGQTLTIQDFKAEWDQLSDMEKDWFKQQPLE